MSSEKDPTDNGQNEDNNEKHQSPKPIRVNIRPPDMQDHKENLRKIREQLNRQKSIYERITQQIVDPWLTISTAACPKLSTLFEGVGVNLQAIEADLRGVGVQFSELSKKMNLRSPDTPIHESLMNLPSPDTPIHEALGKIITSTTNRGVAQRISERMAQFGSVFTGLTEQQAELAKAVSALYGEFRPWKLGDFLTESVRFSSSLEIPTMGNLEEVQRELNRMYGPNSISIDQCKSALVVMLDLVEYSRTTGPIDWNAIVAPEVAESLDRPISDIVLPEELGVDSVEAEELELHADSGELIDCLENSASNKRRIDWQKFALAGTVTLIHLGLGIVCILNGQVILGFVTGLSGWSQWIPHVFSPSEDKDDD